MEQLYHVICTWTNNIDNATYVIMEVLADDRIQWRCQEQRNDNGLTFDIFECKRLIESAKQNDKIFRLHIKYTYEVIPANTD